MSSGESKYSLGHVLGNTSVLRHENPTIRGSIRREDPDANPEPHFTGLTGTSLTVDVTPTGPVVINFTTDNLDDAIAAINLIDPTNLLGREDNGYVVLLNLNGGDKNTLEIVSGDAAPLLGFTLSPQPGSKSFAGEIATSPPGTQQSQDNPQGTTAIAGDEDLKSSSLNRALAGAVLESDRVLRELDALVPVTKEVTGTVVVHAGSGKKVVYVKNSLIRIPVNGYGIGGVSPSGNEIDTICSVLDSDRSPIIDITEATEQRARVLDIYYEDVATGSPALDNSASFTAWATPDGKSIFGPTVSAKDKQTAVAITTIRGDVISATGALFQTNGVDPGDTVIIAAATNNAPFNHDGEYVVVEVLSEELLTVRAKSSFETTFVTSEKPTGLNGNLPGGTNYGTIQVVVGDYMSTKNGVALEVPSWVPLGAVWVRVITSAPMRDLSIGDFLRSLVPNQTSLITGIRDHIINGAAGLRHPADDVDAPAVVDSPDSLTVGTVEDQLAELLSHINALSVGAVAFGGGIDWADTAGDTPVGPTTNPSTTVDLQLKKMLTDLAGAGIDGVAKIRALAVGDLSAGNLRVQLNELDTLWGKLARTNQWTADQTLVDATLFVGGGSVDTKPALNTSGPPTLRHLLWQAQIDVAPNKYARIYRSTVGFELTVNAVWGGASWSSDDTALNSTKLSLTFTDFNLQYHIPTVSTWLDSAWSGDNVLFNLSTFLMTMVGSLDMSGTLDVTGSAIVKGLITIGENLLGSLASAAGPRIVTPTATSARGASAKTLIAEFGDNDEHWRFYVDRGIASDAEIFELTYNAKWQDDAGTYKWFRVDGSRNSACYRFTNSSFELLSTASGDTSPWINSGWTRTSSWGHLTGRILSDSNELDFKDGFLDLDNGTNKNPVSSLSILNTLYPKNMVKAWAKVLLPATTPTISEGFNVTAAAYVPGPPDRLKLTFAQAMANTDYVVVAIAGRHSSESAAQTMAFATEAAQQLVGSFEVGGFIVSTGAQQDLDGYGTGVPVYFIVLGEQ